MILEHAMVDITPGREDAFEAAFAEAKTVLGAADGCRRISLRRGIESPSRYLLLVEWDSLDHHMEGFRQSERFTQWRALIGPYFDGQPSVDHYQATVHS
jgi:heme-degrading monooxygenase HmoA